MTCIGRFTATADGFEGRLQTLTLDCQLALVPAAASEAENAPDYRVFAGVGDAAFEVGAGWKHVGDKAGAFVGVVIEDPALAHPLRANLFQGENDTHVLTWSRPTRRKVKD